MITKLYSVDSKGKTRVVVFEVIKDTTILNSPIYTIKRASGLLDGKLTEQPEIIISSGKAKRSTTEQMQLQLDSMIKEKKDKGYKESTDELGETKTDTSGKPKPMLAKDPKDKLDKIIAEKTAYCSTKLDGVRMMVGSDKQTISRGGGNYNIPAKMILNDPIFDDLHTRYPDALLDGELYVHGLPLEQISGDCRLIDWNETRHSRLQFWVFDILIEDMIFEDRLKILKTFKSSDKIKIVEHVKVGSKKEIMNLHDKWISEGFEGAIWRDANECYKIGGRGNMMLKIKLFQDSEFRVIGITRGLRDEDMVFVCEMPDSDKTFEAKPVGTREQRLEYLNNFEEKYKNKMATVKFFHLSEKGVPVLPTFKNFRVDI